MTKTGRSSRLSAALTLAAACALLFSSSVPKAYAVDASTCGALMGTYSIVPYSSWGTAPFPIQRTWDESDCNHKICEYMQRTFNVVPHLSWGSLPIHLQRVWDTPQSTAMLNCKIHRCSGNRLPDVGRIPCRLLGGRLSRTHRLLRRCVNNSCRHVVTCPHVCR